MTPDTPRREVLLELAARVEAIGIQNAKTLSDRGGGTMFAQMAADCLTAAACLRARAASMESGS